MEVSRARSLAKAVSYRFWGSFGSFVVAFIVTGSVEISGAIAILDTLLKIFLYYLHERGWNYIKWGTK